MVIAEVIEVPEFVMNALLPLSTHSTRLAVPTRRAVVRMPPGMSEPPPGSVRPNAASRSPRHSVGQPPGALLVGAVPVDRHRPERHGRLERDRHRGIDPRELVQREAEREVVAAHAAVLLRERETEKPEFAHAGN